VDLPWSTCAMMEKLRIDRMGSDVMGGGRAVVGEPMIIAQAPGISGTMFQEWCFRSGVSGVVFQEWCFRSGVSGVVFQERCFRSGVSGAVFQEAVFQERKLHPPGFPSFRTLCDG